MMNFVERNFGFFVWLALLGLIMYGCRDKSCWKCSWGSCKKCCRRDAP